MYFSDVCMVIVFDIQSFCHILIEFGQRDLAWAGLDWSDFFVIYFIFGFKEFVIGWIHY